MEQDTPLKRCTRCGESFPATTQHFYKAKKYKDGLFLYCKQCSLAATKASKTKWTPERKAEWHAHRREYAKLPHVKEKTREQHRAYFARPDVRERKREYSRRYKKTEKGRATYRRNWRTRFERLGGRVRAGIRNGGKQRLLDQTKGRCHWCGDPITLETMEVDHRIAVARGGTNAFSNLVASCAPCNRKKTDKMPWEFAGRLF